MKDRIAAHRYKQGNPFSLNTFFKYKEPNNHLPEQIKDEKEVEAFLSFELSRVPNREEVVRTIQSSLKADPFYE